MRLYVEGFSKNYRKAMIGVYSYKSNRKLSQFQVHKECLPIGTKIGDRIEINKFKEQI